MRLFSCLIVLALIFHPTCFDVFTHETLIWEVGQGQFITHVRAGHCYHFDMGGEYFFKTKALLKRCQRRKNILFISHWDWDHISLIPSLRKNFSFFCLATAFTGSLSFKKYRIKKSLSLCKKTIIKQIQVIQPKQSAKKLSANDLSLIFIINNTLLIPGDSTAKMEKNWRIQLPKNIKYLVLGHHGSQTSTSALLLKSLKTLQFAASSSRKAKYGHPHYKVKKNLMHHSRIRPITTENFGTILIKH